MVWPRGGRTLHHAMRADIRRRRLLDSLVVHVEEIMGIELMICKVLDVQHRSVSGHSARGHHWIIRTTPEACDRTRTNPSFEPRQPGLHWVVDSIPTQSRGAQMTSRM